MRGLVRRCENSSEVIRGHQRWDSCEASSDDARIHQRSAEVIRGTHARLVRRWDRGGTPRSTRPAPRTQAFAAGGPSGARRRAVHTRWRRLWASLRRFEPRRRPRLTRMSSSLPMRSASDSGSGRDATCESIARPPVLVDTPSLRDPVRGALGGCMRGGASGSPRSSAVSSRSLHESTWLMSHAPPTALQSSGLTGGGGGPRYIAPSTANGHSSPYSRAHSWRVDVAALLSREPVARSLTESSWFIILPSSPAGAKSPEGQAMRGAQTWDTAPLGHATGSEMRDGTGRVRPSVV